MGFQTGRFWGSWEPPKLLVEHRVVKVVDSCGLREFILVLEKDLLRWVNVSRTIQKV